MLTSRLNRASLQAMLDREAGPALAVRDGAWFLVDPAWGERERAQWTALTARQPSDWDRGQGWLCVPTGGSSGAMKLARHDERTLAAAVAGFCAHFGVNRAPATGLLPIWHVSGLMARVRALATGAEHRATAWKAVQCGERPEPPEAGASFLSLVPTQLARLVGDPAAEAWLRRFRAVLLGGGAAPAGLLARARAAGLPLAPGYGMTETAAMIAAQTPEDFLRDGGGHCGRVLPHAKIGVDGEGRFVVEATSLFVGYWPEVRCGGAAWQTDDLGEIGPGGEVRVVGRADALINSGGEKVNPSEVEAVLRELAGFGEVAVVGLPDAEWGQVVAAFYPLAEGGAKRDLTELRAALAGSLTAAKMPRRLIAVPAELWPRDERGKLRRGELSRLALG